MTRLTLTAATHDVAQNATLRSFLQTTRETYREIYSILAPPRCSSTAFARVFWEHPQIGFYTHEPFDVMYHHHIPLLDVFQAMQQATRIKDRAASSSSLVIKEMTFQVGRNFPLLLSITSRPVIFLIRNPLLSIQSRMKRRQEGGQVPLFPQRESGWHDLRTQVMQCQELQVPYMIVDSTDFRNAAPSIVQKVFARLELSFSEGLLSWRPQANMTLGSLGGVQDHWYHRVLSSTGIEPAQEPVPDITTFPEEGGFQAHVHECLKIYTALRTDANRILP